MPDTKTFSGVSAEVWEKVKTIASERYGTVFDPVASESGTATTTTPIGNIVVDFIRDPAADQMTYILRHKPFFIMSGQIWSGLAEAIERCRQQT